MSKDAINPSHYTEHPCGFQCKEITRYMGFDIGNAVKYAWRLGKKDEVHQELGKVLWYLSDFTKLINAHYHAFYLLDPHGDGIIAQGLRGRIMKVIHMERDTSPNGVSVLGEILALYLCGPTRWDQDYDVILTSIAKKLPKGEVIK